MNRAMNRPINAGAVRKKTAAPRDHWNASGGGRTNIELALDLFFFAMLVTQQLTRAYNEFLPQSIVNAVFHRMSLHLFF